MDIWRQIIKNETFQLLRNWNPQFINESADFVYELVFSSVNLISNNRHSAEMDSFIDKCDLSIKYNYDSFYIDKDKLVNTQLVYNVFLAAFSAFEIPVKNIRKYKVNGVNVGFFSELVKQLGDVENTRKIPLREKLKKQILENMSADTLCDLDLQRLSNFEKLCQIYFFESQSLFLYNKLEEIGLKKLLLNFQLDNYIHEKWFVEMSDIIISKYIDSVDIFHKSLLKKIKLCLSSSAKASGSVVESYVHSLMGEKELDSIFDVNEITLFFEDDQTLDKVKRRTDEMLKNRFLKRHQVSEFVFNQMNDCSGNKNCKFSCPYEDCKYKTLLALLGSHLPHYDVVVINEKVGSETQADFLFTITESDDELQLVLCCSQVYPPSSIYVFDIKKEQYRDVLFLLVRYFESTYALKRKNLIANFMRFGRHFGILLSKVYRK